MNNIRRGADIILFAVLLPLNRYKKLTPTKERTSRSPPG